MSQQILILFIVVAVAVLVGAYAFAAWQRRQRLRERFGPEYDRAVEKTHNVADAEAALQKRVARVERLKLRALPREQAEAFSKGWRRVQALFVDDPDRAVSEADNLVSQVMAARGYPIDQIDARLDDLSVDHPHVVDNYRTARDLVERRRRGEAGTEELRVAVVNYRALFDDLLRVDEPQRRRAS